MSSIGAASSPECLARCTPLGVFVRFVTHVLVLGREELREILFRRRSLVSLLLYMVSMALIALVISNIETHMGPTFGFLKPGTEGAEEFLARFEARKMRELGEYILLMGSLPRPVLIMQCLIVIWFPTLVSLVSCDMVALDMYRGTLRYLVTRTSRLVYYSAKIFSHVVLYSVLGIISWAILLACTFMRAPGFSFDEYMGLTARYAIVTVPYLIFLVASTQFISCWSPKPINAVVRLHLLWVAFFSMLAFFPLLSPFNPHIAAGLLVPMSPRDLRTIAGFLVWSAAFAGAGYVLFRRRPL